MGERILPDDLQLDDRLEFDGHRYVVVGTGPNEATLDRVGDSGVTLKVFKWALTDAIGVELETSLSQAEFSRSVETTTEARNHENTDTRDS